MISEFEEWVAQVFDLVWTTKEVGARPSAAQRA
jgi:hypothetical protein